MLELLRGTRDRVKIGGHHGEIVGGVVARIVLPRYQVVPIHALRDVVVIVFTPVCFASLGRSTPVASAPSPGSITIITSRHGDATNSEFSHFHFERNGSDNMQINANASQRPPAAMVDELDPTKGEPTFTRQSKYKSAILNRYDTSNKFNQW